MFSLKIGNKTMSMLHYQKHYVIGFKNLTIARKVQYTIETNPTLDIVRGDDIKFERTFGDVDLIINLDTTASLFISKCSGSRWDAINDIGYHLHEYKDEEFFLLPFEKNLGIIVAYNIKEETDDEFMFDSYVIDPIDM